MPEPCRSCPRKTQDFGGCCSPAFLVVGHDGPSLPVCSRFAPRTHNHAEASSFEPAPGALRRPSCGAALVAGHDVVREGLAVRRSIGLVFQDTTLDRDLTIAENLRFAARLWSLPERVARPRIDALLRQFELLERRDDPVRTLSGGLRRAVDIARGILHQPRILFLDEPTAGLDPRVRRSLWGRIPALRAAAGLARLLTTHYVEEAEPCDRVAVLDRGELAALGTPAELKRTAGVDSLEEVFLVHTGRRMADPDGG